MYLWKALYLACFDFWNKVLYNPFGFELKAQPPVLGLQLYTATVGFYVIHIKIVWFFSLWEEVKKIYPIEPMTDKMKI